ncbi:Exocyst complex component 4 [Oopsacas minuta]|uniref:Exocyst complex component Sec8 n=1 Tax=Oopsacas minuta TaxID=111878 RepID=A0AAV7JSA5_9METZ|nr:Exocyst complex component 4 [Oopsacas minuta]
MASQQSVLLNAIRRLILINDEEDRRDEQVKLERQLRETDLELQGRVTENFDKLRSVLETFNSVDEKVRVSQVKVATLRNNLRDCKILLRCKRDDLQRLWKEQMEQKKVIELLEEVERMKAIPDKLDALCRTKHFKTAAESLVESIVILGDRLEGVEALKDLRNDIATRKETLKSQLIDELHGCIYFKAPQTFTEDELTPKHDKLSTLPSAISPMKQQSLKSHSRSRSQTAVMLEHQISMANLIPKPVEKECIEIIEDVNNLNPEADLPNYMAILVEALYILDAIPNALEALKSRMLGEMKLIIQRSSTEVRERAEKSGELSPDQNQQSLLKMLLDTAFMKYKSVARAHQIVLKRLSIFEKKMKIDNLYLYSIVNVWNDIQRVIMRMLQDYLDTSTGQNSSTLTAVDVESRDINSFFSKKNIHPRQSLFHLYNSTHSISIMSYMRESKGAIPSLLEGMVDDSTMGHQPTFLQEHLCTPQFRNITIVYQPLEKICRHIELEEMRVETKQEKSNELGVFLSTFVEDEFLVKIKEEIMKKVDFLTSDSQRVVKDEQSGGMHKERRSNKPLLKSCVGIEHALSELKFLIIDLPNYAKDLLLIGQRALETYAKAAQHLYYDLTHVGGDGVNGELPCVSQSHTWAVNNEEMRNHIIRLPMWSSLHNTTISQSNTDQTTLEQESWIVLDQIGSLEIKKNLIITSVANIRNLGLLHESMEWFSNKIKNLLTEVAQAHSSLKSSEIAKLHEVNSTISKLSDHILITLHLEVRMHCLHYLPPAVMRAGNTNEEEAAIEDVGIKEFNRDLCSLEEQLALQLSDMKLRFLFDGIGHLMATVLINTGKKLQRVDGFCITRMSVIVFLLQQNLTNITMSREAELDHARQFYELMRSTPQALLTFATEQEYNFTNAEYEQALAMICKSPDYKGEFERIQEKLREHFDANRSN